MHQPGFIKKVSQLALCLIFKGTLFFQISQALYKQNIMALCEAMISMLFKKIMYWAVVVAQLVEWSLPTLEI